VTDRRQRQKENRAARREVERRTASRRELRRRLVIALAIGVSMTGILALINILGASEDAAGLPPRYLTFRNQPTACGAEPPLEEEQLRFAGPEQQSLGDGPLLATMTTSCGPIVIELDRAYPSTVNSFVFLAGQGFYNGTVIHRIVADFAIYAGDPEADGTGGPGYLVPDELPPEDFIYEDGVVAMQNQGGGTTGSQFFIVVGDNAEVLANNFSVLGRISGGREAIEAIAAIPTVNTPGTVERSLPTETVYIEGIEIGSNDG
jgi:cyclophilin family peptidyl-prolyl cis-trans isomerase